MFEKPWDGRFSEKTDISVEKFTASIDVDRRLYAHDIAGSMAHSQMLAKCGIITEEEASKLIEGLGEIGREIERGEFEFDNSLEDIHMHIEARLIQKVGKVALKLRTARSRNDQVALDMRMYLREETGTIIASLIELAGGIVEMADRYLDAVMPGYTPPPACPAGAIFTPPDGLLRDVRPGCGTFYGLFRTDQCHAPGGGGPGRHHIPH